MVNARWLLDTNALSEPLRPRPNARFMRRLRLQQQRLAISSITWNEALFGLHRLPAGERKEHVREYLFEVVVQTMPIFPYDAAAAEWHAAERARLESLGRMRPFADGQIAAIACVNDLVIVTANERDFAPFDRIEIENWLR